MADETGLALQNLGALNQNFAQNFAPLNNYASQNMNLAVLQERARQEQANKVTLLQQQQEADRQHQAQSERAQFALARMQEEASKDHGIELARFQAGHEDAVRVKQQADAVRANPQARRVLGSAISTLPDTAEGNVALMSAYTKAFSDPRTSEKLDVEEAKGLNNEVHTILGRLNTNTPGSAQSKQAVLAFLGTPGVSDLLIKKGRLTAQDIQQIAASGDSSKVIDAIQKTASSAYTPWGERDYLTQLIPAWNSAMATAGVQQTPSQMVDATSLKALLDMRDKIIGRGNIYTDSAMKDIFGEQVPVQPKLPPPPAAMGLTAPTTMTKTPASSVDNPFIPPERANSGKTGLASLIESMVPQSNTAYNQAVTNSGQSPSTAFVPQRLADDPHTEFALRKRLLDQERVWQAVRQGVSSAIPFTKTYTPTYTAGNQTTDEDKLQSLVEGLYSSPKGPALDPTLFNSLTPSSPTPTRSTDTMDKADWNLFIQGLANPQK